jgi:hypothetical protein
VLSHHCLTSRDRRECALPEASRRSWLVQTTEVIH